MTQSLTDRVRRLLEPTDAELQWYQDIMALDKEAAVPILTRILSDEQEKRYTRRQAALILGLLEDERAADALVEAMDADDNILRGRAAEALGKFQDLGNDHVQSLVQGLQDDDHFVRECSAKALGQLQHPDALPGLKQMASTDDMATNRQVAENAIERILGEG